MIDEFNKYLKEDQLPEVVRDKLIANIKQLVSELRIPTAMACCKKLLARYEHNPIEYKNIFHELASTFQYTSAKLHRKLTALKVPTRSTSEDPTAGLCEAMEFFTTRKRESREGEEKENIDRSPSPSSGK